MPACAHKLCVIALILVVWVGVGCGDDEINGPSIVSVGNTDTGASNTGPDAGDANSDAVATDERCEGLQSGARCALPHASGVCVEGQCQFLSCEAGFRDCDTNVDNGCETDITTADECGVCGVSCTDPESCQQSRAGWVCSVSPVCPDARYDLDGDSENGCEWSAQWGEDGIFDPVSFQPHVAAELASGAFSVAGRTLDARLVLSTDATNTTDAAEPVATELEDTVEAHAIETFAAAETTPPATESATELAAVAWTDAVTLSAASGSASDDGVFRYACDQTPRQFNSVAASASSAIFAATLREVLQIERGAGCSQDDTSASSARQLCDAPSAVFGMADYIEAYVPELDPAACDACLPDTTVCPAFRPIGLEYLEQSARLVVFTERGFLILETSDSGLVAGPRFETDDSFATGAAIEEDGGVRVYLLTTDGTLRRFVVDSTVRPAGPDVRLLIGARDPARLVPTSDGALLAYDARNAWLIGPLERSARIEQLSEPSVFLGDERIVFGAGFRPTPGEEFSLLYFGVGRFYLRDVRMGQ